MSSYDTLHYNSCQVSLLLRQNYSIGRANQYISQTFSLSSLLASALVT